MTSRQLCRGPNIPVRLPGAYASFRPDHIKGRACENFADGKAMEWGEHQPVPVSLAQSASPCRIQRKLLSSGCPLEGVAAKLDRGGGLETSAADGRVRSSWAKAFQFAVRRHCYHDASTRRHADVREAG